MSTGTSLPVYGKWPRVQAHGHSSIVIWLLERAFDPLFATYVYFLVLLPSGSLFGVNVKIICFFLLLPLALLKFADTRGITLVHVAVLLALPAVFLLWILIAQIYAFDTTLSLLQYKDIMTTFASCWLAAVYCGDKEATKVRFLRMVLFAEVIACLIKIALLAYAFYKGIPVSLMVDAINTFFGVNLMGMDFEAALGRIQFVADGLIPLCMYMLLRYRRKLQIGSVGALIMFLLLVISLIFTFSRYFWGFAALVFCLGMLFGKKDRFHAWILSLLGLVLLASLPAIVTLYQLRFSKAIAGESDNVRTQQIPVLERFFLDAPLLGHGFGSHTPELLRSIELPYAYEVQLYALAGQEGIAGLLLMGALTLYYFHPLLVWNKASFNRKGNLVIILFAWLSAGLFNPMLFNSAAAMSYAAISALATIGDQPERAKTLSRHSG